MKAIACVVAVVASCGSGQKPQPIANVGPPAPAPAPVEHKSDMAMMRDEVCRCADAPCLDDVVKKWAAKASDEREEKKEPTEEDMRLAKQMTECATKLMTASMPPPPPPPTTSGWTSGVPECDTVIATYERLFDCDALKAAGEAANKAQRDALDAMKRGWGDLKDAPQATKDAMAEGCKQALDGIRQSAAAMGCTL